MRAWYACAWVCWLHTEYLFTACRSNTCVKYIDASVQCFKYPTGCTIPYGTFSTTRLWSRSGIFPFSNHPSNMCMYIYHDYNYCYCWMSMWHIPGLHMPLLVLWCINLLLSMAKSIFLYLSPSFIILLCIRPIQYCGRCVNVLYETSLPPSSTYRCFFILYTWI